MNVAGVQAFFQKKLFAIDGLTFTVLGVVALLLVIYLLFVRK